MLIVILLAVLVCVLLLAWYFALSELAVMWRAGFCVQAIMLLIALIGGTFAIYVGFTALVIVGVSHGI